MKETKKQRSKETKKQRNKETKKQRSKETKKQRNKETKKQRQPHILVRHVNPMFSPCESPSSKPWVLMITDGWSFSKWGGGTLGLHSEKHRPLIALPSGDIPQHHGEEEMMWKDKECNNKPHPWQWVCCQDNLNRNRAPSMVEWKSKIHWKAGPHFMLECLSKQGNLWKAAKRSLSVYFKFTSKSVGFVCFIFCSAERQSHHEKGAEIREALEFFFFFLEFSDLFTLWLGALSAK